MKSTGYSTTEGGLTTKFL